MLSNNVKNMVYRYFPDLANKQLGMAFRLQLLTEARQLPSKNSQGKRQMLQSES